MNDWSRLVDAYGRTLYTAAGIDLRIGRRCGAMDRLLRANRARAGVLITAWNPGSRRMPAGWNCRRQAALAQALRCDVVFPARGAWRRWSEEHLLALIPPARARVLARRFRQNALVIVAPGKPVRLVAVSPAANGLGAPGSAPTRTHA